MSDEFLAGIRAGLDDLSQRHRAVKRLSGSSAHGHKKVYIVDPSHANDDTLGLIEGLYRARLDRDGGYHAVKAEVVVPRDPETGDVIGDVSYCLWIDDQMVDDWQARFSMGLIGEPLDEAAYRQLLADGQWCESNYGVRPGAKVNLTTIPLVTPPGR